MTTSLLMLLFACGAPTSPAPTPPSTTIGSPLSATPQPVDDADRSVPIRVPGGATEMPPELACPDDNPGMHGCFRLVQGATIHLGAQATDPAGAGYDADAAADEGPVRDVAVPAFWLQHHEVIAAQYDDCVLHGGCSKADLLEGGAATVGVSGKGMYPAVGVSWQGADAYCRWLGGRLPTEAEYELVTRGTEGRRYVWGDHVVCDVVVAERSGEAEEHALAEREKTACVPVLAALEQRLGEEATRELGEPIGRLGHARLIAECERIAKLPPEQIEQEARALSAEAIAAPDATSVSGDLGHAACVPVLTSLRERLGDTESHRIGEKVGRLGQARLLAECERLAKLTPSQIEEEVRALAEEAARLPDEACQQDGPVDPGALQDRHPQRFVGLTGNVREWVADDYDPRGGAAIDHPLKLTKGGGFMSDAVDLRATARDPLPADAKLPDVGFRCAWSP